MKSKLRKIRVCAIQDLSFHMRRIIFSGDDLQDFPEEYETAHVKIVILNEKESGANLKFTSAMKKRMRSYTVRGFDTVKHQLTVDFAVNDHQGLVSDWALDAQIGDYVGLGGPGPIKYKDLYADWHLFAGDLTALPVMAATIEKLPSDSTGYAFLQIPHMDDKQFFQSPKNLQIIWIIHDDVSYHALLEAMAKIEWPDGVPHILVAGEDSQIKAIHQFLKTKRSYREDKTYISSYWTAPNVQ